MKPLMTLPLLSGCGLAAAELAAASFSPVAEKVGPAQANVLFN